MRELRPLRLPQLVEDRRIREKEDAMDSPDSMSIGHNLHLSQSSTSSDATSPVTPTFSLRGHSRFSSSSSSLASSPTMRESLDGFGTPKRPLTDVKEEPQEREEDYEMLESVEKDQNYDCKFANDDSEILQRSYTSCFYAEVGLSLTRFSRRQRLYLQHQPWRSRNRAEHRYTFSNRLQFSGRHSLRRRLCAQSLCEEAMRRGVHP